MHTLTHEIPQSHGHGRRASDIARCFFTMLKAIRRGWLRLFLGLMFFFFFSGPALATDFESWETKGGMLVLFAPAPLLPMLDIQLVFDAGSARDGRLGGLARLTNLALGFGTAEMDADMTAERFESVGARFSTSTARDMAIVRLRTLTEPDWMESAIATFTDLLAEPAFPEDDLARSRRQALQRLQQERQEPGSIGSRRFYQLAYGDHPYANDPLGSEESVPRITRADLHAFFKEHYTTENAVLALTGALDPDTARSIAARIEAALPRGARPAALPPVPKATAPREEWIPFESEQAHIFIGSAALRRDDPERFALSVANHAFGGGGFTSRLFREVRTKRGLAYSVSSHVQPMTAQGPFLITMQTGVDQTEQALEVLRGELGRFHEDGITREELEASQANIIGRFPLGLASNSDIVATLAMIGFYALPLDYLQTYTERIAAITAEQAHQAVQDRLNPETMVTVVVGRRMGPEGSSEGSIPADRLGE